MKVVAFYNMRGTCEQWIKEGTHGDSGDYRGAQFGTAVAGEAVGQLICDGVDIDNAVAGQCYLAIHRQSGGGKRSDGLRLRCHSFSIE